MHAHFEAIAGALPSRRRTRRVPRRLRPRVSRSTYVPVHDASLPAPRGLGAAA
ncbi:hypothetical protein [Microbacterium sp.]|uniref:hypothetical protein n=1 Tax=Microbacterium sp. TaxID=51671 RepID=UPI0037C73F82